MRALVIAALIVSCTNTDDEPRPTDAELHEKVDCFDVWTVADLCEVPCASELHHQMSQAIPPACVGTFPFGLTGGPRMWDCHPDAVFEYEGVRGCCARDGLGDERTVYFAVCEGE